MTEGHFEIAPAADPWPGLARLIHEALGEVNERLDRIEKMTEEREELSRRLVKALAANAQWARTLTDVQQRHAEVKAERDEARAKLAATIEDAARWRP